MSTLTWTSKSKCVKINGWMMQTCMYGWMEDEEDDTGTNGWFV